MIVFKRIVASLSAFVITFMTFAVPAAPVAKAGIIEDAAYVYDQSNIVRQMLHYVFVAIGAGAGASIGSIVLPGVGTVTGTTIGVFIGDFLEAGVNDLASYYAAGYTDEDFAEAYWETYYAGGSYGDGAGRDSISSGDLVSSVTGFSATKAVSTTTSYSVNYRIPLGLYDHRDPLLCSTLKSLGVYDKVLISGINTSYLYGYCFLQDGSLAIGVFTNPHKSINPSLFGVFKISDLDPVYFSQGDDISNRLYYSKKHAEAAAGSDFATSRLYALTFDDVSDGSQSSYWMLKFECFFKNSTDFTWSDNTVFDGFTWDLQEPYIYSNCSLYIPDRSTISLRSTTVDDGGDRLGTYMEDLAAHNQNNPYQNNPYIPNYYISPDAGTSLYSPAIFFESSKTFTEPVTGAQILCTDWIYHYVPDGVVAGIDGLEHEYLGAYILSPTENSFAYDSSFVDLICLIYTDSFLRIGFMVKDTSTDVGFRSLGSQDYSYVTVAQTECGLGDHDMTWEVTQPPTCSGSGIQTGTCSICGDIQTYQLDPLPHTYQSSVTQQPTCADAGVMIYACTVCGFSYTEQIAPTGDHDWLASEVTGTVYDLPEGTSCPDCSGTNYTHSLSGDLYDCTCADCGTEWTVRAEITYGRTTYTCSVCGASYVEQEGEEDGLFTAIANFLSDGITWVTDKFTELAESLSGIHTTFRTYLERIRNVGGDFPALIAAAVGVMPSDFMDVVWFGVICMVLLAVYLKFFR